MNDKIIGGAILLGFLILAMVHGVVNRYDPVGRMGVDGAFYERDNFTGTVYVVANKIEMRAIFDHKLETLMKCDTDLREVVLKNNKATR